jgi:hypothetical protein
MDWRNYQFWRKEIRRLDAETTEFDLLVQRAKQRIVLGNKIRGCLELFQRSSTRSKKIPEREDFY